MKLRDWRRLLFVKKEILMFGGSSLIGLTVFFVEAALEASVSSSTQIGNAGGIATTVGAVILFRFMFRFSAFDSAYFSDF